ncbi:hypothetical protein FF1_010358 [Malus domestica]
MGTHPFPHPFFPRPLIPPKSLPCNPQPLPHPRQHLSPHTHHLLLLLLFFPIHPCPPSPTPNLPSPPHRRPLFLHLTHGSPFRPDARNGDVNPNPNGVFVGSGVFKSGDPAKRARFIVQAVTHSRDPDVLAEVSCRLEEAMVGFKGLFGWISGFKGLFGWIIDVVFLVGVDIGKRRRR